jgi:hypothetical protein
VDHHQRTSTALALALAGTALVAGPGVAYGQGGASGVCEVRTMAWPEGAYDGTVMDIEVVPGLGSVYYGSYVVADESGAEARRAVVWYGLDAEPVQVGPAGTAWDVAFELTASGKVNGQSTLEESGRERAWVQDLRSGRLTWVDTDGAAEGIYVRRINDRGDAAGSVFYGGFTADAVAWWPRVDRPGRVLFGGEDGVAEAWAINNKRTVAGSYAHYLPDYGFHVPQGALWSARGDVTVLASNPGVEADTHARLLTDHGQAAGSAWYGDIFEGHAEGARWPSPNRLESLGLLPGGGYSAVFGQSAEGWVVGVADHFDPDSPGAQDWGAVEHSVLWTDEPDVVRVLPSPYAVAEGQSDWRSWFGGVAHGVHTGLDQVGTASHGGWNEDGTIGSVPTVYVNASRCGELVETTHQAFWEEPGDTLRTLATTGETASGTSMDRPSAYDHGVIAERVRARE